MWKVLKICPGEYTTKTQLNQVTWAGMVVIKRGGKYVHGDKKRTI